MALAVAFTLSFTPLRASHDEWWHLKTGKIIDESGLPENDVFTYTAEAIPWHNHEWLTQVAMWRVYRWGEISGAGGVRALIAFKTLLVVAAFAGLGAWMAARTGAPAISCFSAALACGVARRTLYPRPPFVSYALMALTLGAMMSWRDRRLSRAAGAALLLCAPPLFALWSNLHGGFVAGLVIMGAFSADAGAAWALALWRKEPTREPLIRFLSISAATLASFAATLANPSGFEIYALIPRVMNDPILTRMIFELQPPDWRFVWALDAAAVAVILAAIRPRRAGQWWPALAVVAVYLMLARALPSFAGWNAERGRDVVFILATVVLAARSKQGLGLPFAMLLPFFAHQAIHHVRHLPLLGVVLVPALAHGLTDWVRSAAFGYDGYWRAGEPVSWRPEERERRMRKYLGGAEIAAACALAIAAAFYLFWPGEAYYFVRPEPGSGGNAAASGGRSAALRGPSHLGLNLALLGGEQLQRGAYPVEAVDYLIAVNPPGRLWNAGNYAGYLIWRLAPEKYKLFTDNRYDIYGGRFVPEQEIVLQGAESPGADWREVLKKWNVRTIFIPVDAPLRARLALDPGWREIYKDRAFCIWTRESTDEKPAA